MKEIGWKVDNFRVIIDVDGHPWLCTADKDERFTRDHANDLVKVLSPLVESLSRHYKSIRVEGDLVCKFCGHDWNAALDENKKPICCGKAVELSDKEATQ